MGVAAIAGDLLAPVVGQVLGPVLSDIGSAVGQGVTGGIGNILNEAMQAFKPLESLMQGFMPSQAQASPSPFSPGAFTQGAFDNPLGSIFGTQGSFGMQGGTSSSSGTQGLNPNALNVGGENFSQLQSDMQAAAQSGDPAQMEAAQQKMDQYTQMLNMLTSMEKSMNDVITNIARNIA